MTKEIEIPNRTNAEMVERFEEWAKTCEQANPEDLSECFEEALSIMLEARLPRADNEEDLKRQIKEAIDDTRPSLSTEEAFAEIKQNSEQFHLYLERFRALIKLEAWESVAMVLLPCSERPGPGYFGGNLGQYYQTIMSTKGYDEGVYQNGAGCIIHSPVSSGGEPLVKGFHAQPGVAMLIAILRAHATWPDLWQR